MNRLTNSILAAAIMLASCGNSPLSPSAESPTLGQSRAIALSLGKIEAENYSQMSGIQTENCSEGGLNVGWFDKGDWLVYTLSVPSTGSYLVQYRVASLNGATLTADYNAGKNYLGSVTIPATGGWQNWTTVSLVVNLPAGTVNFGVGTSTGGLNFNWLNISAQGAPTNSPAPTALPTTAPTTIPNSSFTFV